MKQWNKIFQLEKEKFTSSLAPLKKIIAYFKKHNVYSILDLGCGTGKHSFYLAKAGFKVVGMDIASEAIKLAKQKLNEEKNINLKFIQGSMYEKFPFEDNYFDAVISLRTLNHGKKHQIKFAISQVYRILKKGGFIFITVIKINGLKKIPGQTTFNNLPVKIIAPYTYIPLEGKEKGIVHFLFNKKILLSFFKKFKVTKFFIHKGI